MLLDIHDPCHESYSEHPTLFYYAIFIYMQRITVIFLHVEPHLSYARTSLVLFSYPAFQVANFSDKFLFKCLCHSTKRDYREAELTVHKALGRIEKWCRNTFARLFRVYVTCFSNKYRRYCWGQVFSTHIFLYFMWLYCRRIHQILFALVASLSQRSIILLYSVSRAVLLGYVQPLWIERHIVLA